MLASVRSAAVLGIDAYLVDVTLGDSSGLDVLRQAIEGGQLLLVCQPKLDLQRPASSCPRPSRPA